MKLNYIILITIFCILVYHYYIQNNLEKIFFEIYLNYENVKRPEKICNSNLNKGLKCFGLPSRHAELSAILFFLLYFKNFISLNVCLFFIFIFSTQRFIYEMHTITQIIIAVILGFIYSQIYIFYNFSFYSFLIVFFIGFILNFLTVYKIDIDLKEPIPKWVDNEMIPSIKKKLETPYYLRFLSIYANAINTGTTYISWHELENYLDIMIEKIKLSDVKYDAVIGIKTGGAIISDYISNKLGLQNYKIKLSKNEYNCDKKPIDTINEVFQRQILNKFGKYKVCEGIDDNLKGKNIILIDEMVSSGTTMSESINYLRNEKHVNIIYPTCISLSTQKYKKDIYINKVIPNLVFVWPWGYDN
jgi:hypoxanthine phosphoribosyltransferase